MAASWLRVIAIAALSWSCAASPMAPPARHPAVVAPARAPGPPLSAFPLEQYGGRLHATVLAVAAPIVTITGDPARPERVDVELKIGAPKPVSCVFWPTRVDVIDFVRGALKVFAPYELSATSAQVEAVHGRPLIAIELSFADKSTHAPLGTASIAIAPSSAGSFTCMYVDQRASPAFATIVERLAATTGDFVGVPHRQVELWLRAGAGVHHAIFERERTPGADGGTEEESHQLTAEVRGHELAVTDVASDAKVNAAGEVELGSEIARDLDRDLLHATVARTGPTAYQLAFEAGDRKSAQQLATEGPLRTSFGAVALVHDLGIGAPAVRIAELGGVQLGLHQSFVRERTARRVSATDLEFDDDDGSTQTFRQCDGDGCARAEVNERGERYVLQRVAN